MSKLIHGTSLHKALMLIENPLINEQNQEKLYFFESEREEAYAGALAFSTGQGLRSINNSFKLSFIDSYMGLNPNFPKGIYGKVLKFFLKIAVKDWQKKQEQLKTTENDNIAAIIECEKVNELITVNRKNIVFESYLKEADFDKIKVLAIYVDQSHKEEVLNFMKKVNSDVKVKSIEMLVENI